MRAASHRATAKSSTPLARPIATDKCHPLTSAPRAVWQNRSLSPASSADPKQSTPGRAVSSFLVSTKGRLNLQIIAERDLQRECFVPRTEIPLQYYLHPTTHCNPYVLVGGPQPLCHFTVAAGMHGRKNVYSGKMGTWQSSTRAHGALPPGIGICEGREALPSRSDLFSRAMSFYLQSVGNNVGLKEAHCRHWCCHSPLQEELKRQ